MILGFDTATAATAVAVLLDDGRVLEARHDPAPGERPGHATRLLPMAVELLGEAGAGLAAVRRVAVGVGPGTFTGLRIGIATARALAQGIGAELAGISTLRTLAAGVQAPEPTTVLAVLDARRGELYAAAYEGERELLPAAARTPEALAAELGGLSRPAQAVGDGAVASRAMLEASGLEVPPDASSLHRVSAGRLCRLAGVAPSVGRDALRPDYLRLPDADLRTR